MPAAPAVILMFVDMLPNKSKYVNMFLVSTTETAETFQTTVATRSPCCAPIGDASLSGEEAVQLASILKALADPVRLQLMSIIMNAPEGEVCTCDLPEAVGRSQPTVSHHLSLLVKAGLVERLQRGKWAWFRANPAQLADLAKILTPPNCC